MTRVILPRPLVNRLLAAAQQAPDEEVCGLISTRAGLPAVFYPVTNAATDKGRLFQLDPQGQITAMRSMRERGEELFAIYHSHPHAPAAPSARDVAESQSPDALHLIVSLDTKGVLDLRGFYIRAGTVEEVILELTQD